VEVLPLVFSKELHVTNITLDQPQVSLLHTTTGQWNYSSLGQAGAQVGAAASNPPSAPKGAQAKPSAPAPSGNSSASSLSVRELEIKDGRVVVALSNTGKSHVYDGVTLKVTDFSFTSEFPFTISANLPAGGRFDLEGKAGPISATDASLTPFSGKITVKSLDVAASGFLDPSSGIAGIADFDATIASDGKQLTSAGTAVASKLKLSPKGSPAATPVKVKYNLVHDLQKQSGDLSEGDVSLGNAVAKLTGSYHLQPEPTTLAMKLNADAMPVDDLKTLLPALGIVLPSGSALEGGTLTSDLTIDGPVDKLVIVGPIKLSNTKLAGFSLGSKLSAVSKLTGSSSTGSDTVIQNLSLNARVDPAGVTTSNVNLTVPAIGVITGNGSISPSDALDYKMKAALSGGAAGGLTQITGLGGKEAGGGIPFFIQGTTSDPKFVPDMKGMLNSQLKSGMGGGGSLVNSVGGILGKKKPN
jgi:AsmA protein